MFIKSALGWLTKKNGLGGEKWDQGRGSVNKTTPRRGLGKRGKKEARPP